MIHETLPFYFYIIMVNLSIFGVYLVLIKGEGNYAYAVE